MDKEHTKKLTIVDAVDMLSVISEIGEGGVIEDPILEEQLNLYKEAAWIGEQYVAEKEERVKEMFRVILAYLRDFYEKQSGQQGSSKEINRIHSIMVLVGKAAEKLAKHTTLFQKADRSHLKDLQELKDLKNFYLFQVQGETTSSSKSIQELWDRSFSSVKNKDMDPIDEGRVHEEHYPILDGVESVKEDAHYELFYLKKEDKSLFFNQDITRNIQHYCRENNYFEDISLDDPLIQVKSWHDKCLHMGAKNILMQVRSLVREFYSIAGPHHARGSVQSINKALMALMLAANNRNLLRTFAGKSCYQYFRDFVFYLRELLNCHDYLEILSKSEQHKKGTPPHLILDLSYGLCHALFVHMGHGDEMQQVLARLTQEKKLSKEEKESLKGLGTVSAELYKAHASLGKSLETHPNGPLFKMLDLVIEGGSDGFDPMIMDNIPQALFDIETEQQLVSVLRTPSPTTQNYVDQAHITEEFKGFLRSLNRYKSKDLFLIINLQGRCEWDEYARSLALERLQRSSEFSEIFMCVTLPKRSDFYQQFAPYQDLSHAYLFIDQLSEHIESESSGFFFPKMLKQKLSGDVIKSLLKEVHQSLFHGKKTLSRKERLDFIELFYTLLSFKIIELVQPRYFSYVCKDGLDVSLTASVQMAAVYQILGGSFSKEKACRNLNEMLYTAPLLIRERSLIPERFHRMLHAISALENLSRKGELKSLNQAFFSGKLKFKQ